MVFLKRKKAADILSAQELLRVNPEEVKNPGILKITLMLILTFLYVSTLFHAYRFWRELRHESEIILFGIGFIIVVTFVYYMAISILVISSRTFPLSFTTKGIAKYPYLAEYWGDIRGFGWESFSGLRRLPFQPRKEVVTIFIFNKGGLLRQRSITRHGHSILAALNVFFDEKQIQAAEIILENRGIKKYGDMFDAM